MKRWKYAYHICMKNCMKGNVGMGKVHVAADTVKIKKKCLEEDLDLVCLWIHDYGCCVKCMVKKRLKISQLVGKDKGICF